MRIDFQQEAFDSDLRQIFHKCYESQQPAVSLRQRIIKRAWAELFIRMPLKGINFIFLGGEGRRKSEIPGLMHKSS